MPGKSALVCVAELLSSIPVGYALEEPLDFLQTKAKIVRGYAEEPLRLTHAVFVREELPGCPLIKAKTAQAFVAALLLLIHAVFVREEPQDFSPLKVRIAQVYVEERLHLIHA